MHVYWFEATPWDPIAGAATTVRATSAELTKAVTLDSGAEWLPVLRDGPVTSLSVFDGAAIQASRLSSGKIECYANDTLIDYWAGLMWHSRPIKIYEALINLTDPVNPVFPSTIAETTLIFDGQVASFDADQCSFELTSTKPSGKIAASTYAGTGGAEGLAGLKNTPKPWASGQHFNRRPVLVHPGLQMYQVHGYGAIEELTNVRERGIVLDQTRVAHANIAALIAATVAQTEIHVCLASGMFRLGFTPFGDITADFKGDNLGGFSARLGVIIKRLLTGPAAWSLAKIDTASLDNLDSSLPHDAFCFDDGGTDIVDMLNSLLTPIGAYWDVDEANGEIYVGLFRKQAVPTHTISSGNGLLLLDPDIMPTRDPFWRNRIGYLFNPTVIEQPFDADGIAEAIGVEPGANVSLGDQLLRDEKFASKWPVVNGVTVIATTRSRTGFAAQIGMRPNEKVRFLYNPENVADRVRCRPGQTMFVAGRLSYPNDQCYHIVDGEYCLFDGCHEIISYDEEKPNFSLNVYLQWLDSLGFMIKEDMLQTVQSTAIFPIEIFGNAQAPELAEFVTLAVGYDPIAKGRGVWEFYEPLLSNHQPGSDITALSAQTQELASDVTIMCDPNGEPLLGQLPVTLMNKHKVGALNRQQEANWVFDYPPDWTVTIDNQPGSVHRGEITLNTVPASGSITVKSRIDTVELTGSIKVTRQIQGQEATPSTQIKRAFLPVVTTGFVPIFDPFAFTVASSGAATLAFVAEYTLTDDGQASLIAKWQQSADAISWTDIGAPQTGTLSQRALIISEFVDDYDFRFGYFKGPPNPSFEPLIIPGALSIGHVLTGLTPGLSYFRIVARASDPSSLILTGEASIKNG
jgi:hypothetical protein